VHYYGILLPRVPELPAGLTALDVRVELQLEIEPGDYGVNADLVGLQQIIMNLSLNARDAMPEGGLFKIWLSGKGWKGTLR